MTTRFFTTPDPPRMLTPAASDHRTSTIYTGIRAIAGSCRALRSDAMTRGNKVYPMMHTDWKKELFEELAIWSSRYVGSKTYIFPPRSLIWRVTTASPIQTIENTPENTRLDCSSDALIDKNILSRRQNINGPLKITITNISTRLPRCSPQPHLKQNSP